MSIKMRTSAGEELFRGLLENKLPSFAERDGASLFCKFTEISFFEGEGGGVRLRLSHLGHEIFTHDFPPLHTGMVATLSGIEGRIEVEPNI